MSHALFPAHAGGLSLLWAIPFIGVLLTIALAPLLAPTFWHRHYGKCVALWALAFLLPEMALNGVKAGLAALIEAALDEYLPFILLLGALFAVAGGLRLTGAPRGGPGVNTAMLALGTLMASVIGTTGAAMVMVRPMIRANRHRRQTAHIFVFFILLIANVGGALSPLGDPPLFLGYLAGVPFFWPLLHLWAPTLVVAVGLLALFYGIDHYIHSRRGEAPPVIAEIEKLGIEGGINLLLLAAVVSGTRRRQSTSSASPGGSARSSPTRCCWRSPRCRCCSPKARCAAPMNSPGSRWSRWRFSSLRSSSRSSRSWQ